MKPVKAAPPPSLCPFPSTSPSPFHQSRPSPIPSLLFFLAFSFLTFCEKKNYRCPALVCSGWLLGSFLCVGVCLLTLCPCWLPLFFFFLSFFFSLAPYLSTAVLAFVATTASWPMAFRTVHWKQREGRTGDVCQVGKNAY